MFPLVDVLRSALEAIAWSDLLAFLLRLTAIAGLGVAALALLPRASAAVRHRIAVATLATSLALPLATSLPPQRVAVLPVTPETPAVAAPLHAVSRPLPPAPSDRALEIAPRPVADSRDTDDAPVVTEAPAMRVEPAIEPAPRHSWRTTLARVWSETLIPAFRETLLSGGMQAIALRALLAAIALVTLLRLGRTLLAMIAARRLAALSVPVTDARLRHAFGLALAALGITRPVELRQSSRLAVPVVTGIVWPTLLLPPSAATWPRERLASVLMHELAHIGRHDPLSQLIARLATSLFWFHPLVHLLERSAWLSCEQACDDVVLANGARPSAYAEDLLAIARDARPRDASRGLAPAFVRRSGLERRLASILEPGLRRGAASRWTRLGISVTALVSLAMLGPVRLVPAVASLPRPATAGETDRSDDGDRVAAEKRSEAGPVAVADRRETSADEAAASIEDADAEESADADEGGTVEHASETLTSFAPAVMSPAGSGEPTIELAGASGQDWFNRGRDRYNDGDYASAASAYMRAAAAGYRTGTSFYNAACSWALDGQTEPALAALEAALDAGFDQPDLFSEDDDLDVLRNDPKFKDLLRRARGTDKTESKRLSAVHEYESLKTARSRDAGEWRSTGIALMRSGETERAVDAFERQYAIDSSSSCIYNTACALALGGQRKEALDVLEQAILAGSGDADHMLQDDDLASLRKDEEFDELVNFARDLELDMSPGIGGRGSWRRTLPKYERAARQYPEAGRAWFNLGYARLAAGDPEGSVQANRRALSLRYRVATTSYNLACGYAQMHEPDDAIHWLQRAEAAGIGLGTLLNNDDDLDPIRSDRRYQRMRERWRQEQREEKHGKHKFDEDDEDDEG